MALIEVDANEYERLQAELNAARPSKALLDKLAAKPGSRLAVQKIVKEAFPDTHIPELVAAEAAKNELTPMVERLAALETRLTDDEAAREKSARDARFGAQIESGRNLLRQRGYSTEKIEAIEKQMETRGIADYDAAEALYARDNRARESVAEPSAYDRNWNMAAPDAGDEDHKLLLLGGRKMTGARQFVAKQINSTLREMRGGQRHTA